MRAMARTAVAGGIGVLVLMLAATMLSVIFATRGAMATNRPIVEVLHFIGAKNGFIAGQFQRHFLMLGLEGGADRRRRWRCWLFALAGIGRRLSVGTAGGDQIAALFGTFSIGLGGYVAIVGADRADRGGDRARLAPTRSTARWRRSSRPCHPARRILRYDLAGRS